jgi:hypothetical protein
VAVSAALLVTALAVPAAAADKGDTSTWQSLYFSVEAGNIYGDRITVRADGGTDWTGADYMYASVDVSWDDGDINCYSGDVDSDAQIEWGNKAVSLVWDSPCGPVDLTWQPVTKLERNNHREIVDGCKWVSHSKATEAAHVTGSVAGIPIDTTGDEFLMVEGRTKVTSCK